MQPTSKKALLSSTPEQQQLILGLSLKGSGRWSTKEIGELTKLSLIHVLHLDLTRIGMRAPGVQHLISKTSPFKNVTSLDLSWNPIRDAGVGHLVSNDTFRNVVSLKLNHAQISPNGVLHLVSETSPFKAEYPHGFVPPESVVRKLAATAWWEQRKYA